MYITPLFFGVFLIFKSSIKYNLLSFDELVINLDRLSRFKLPEESFPRVFYSIILKHLIEPRLSKNDIENQKAEFIAKTVKLIWNDSVSKVCKIRSNSNFPNIALKSLIKNTFKNIDERTKIFLNTDLNIASVLKNLNYEQIPLNLKFLMKLLEHENDGMTFEYIREKYSLCFPVEKLLIVEGITEEILLPVFADKLKKNFNKNGIFILGAGGKSKSPSLYLKLKNRLKIPVIMLFDEDAKEICTNLKDILLKKDKYILIEHGEFEDILQINLIKRALNNEYLPAVPLNISDLRKSEKMCNNIEAFYRTRHLGEFKKSKLAKIIAQNVKYETDITEEIKKIISHVVL